MANSEPLLQSSSQKSALIQGVISVEVFSDADNTFRDRTHPFSLSFRPFGFLKDGKILPSVTAEFCKRGSQKLILKKNLILR